MALTPDEIHSLRDACEEIAQPVIEWLLKDIAERVKEAGEMTSTAAYEIYRAQALGESKKALQDYLKKQLKLSQKEIRKLMRKAAKFSSNDDYQRVGVHASDADMDSLMQIADAAAKVAGQDLNNITQTMGMVSPITGEPRPLQKVYQDCMDEAVKLVATGGTSASQAAREATRKLAERGVATIDYASGVSTELGAAVRRNLMGGMGLMVEQITQKNHDALGCDGWEISAHAASAPDHEDIQGRQYSDAEYEKLNNSLKRRIGTLNCGHVAMPIILGVNSPQYTEAQLQALKDENAKGVVYEGRHMTGYEATQYQNRIERAIRKQKRRILLSEGTEDEEQLLADQIRLTRLNQEYKRFNAAMGFKSRQERLEVIGWGRKQAAKVSAAVRAYTKAQERDILIEKLRTAGNLPKTAEIHLKPKRIDIDSLSFDNEHINKERVHNVSEEQAKRYIQEAGISVTVWNGQFERYYGREGAAYVNTLKHEIRTAYSEAEFTDNIKALVEEMKKNGILG